MLFVLFAVPSFNESDICFMDATDSVFDGRLRARSDRRFNSVKASCLLPGPYDLAAFCVRLGCVVQTLTASYI